MRKLGVFLTAMVGLGTASAACTAEDAPPIPPAGATAGRDGGPATSTSPTEPGGGAPGGNGGPSGGGSASGGDSCASQGAACFGAAYEFIFNVRYQLKKHHLLDKAPLTFVTAEPFLGHFGIGGFGNAQMMSEAFFKMQHINWRTNAVVKEVLPDGVALGDGEVLPSKFTMIIPRFLGIDAIRNTPGLANANGFIETDDSYRHKQYPEVYAAGVAVHVPPVGETAVP